MPLATALYNQGLLIYNALNTILAPASTNAQIGAALGVVNASTALYQNQMSAMWNFLQPYFPHYNPQYVAAFQYWVTHGVTAIDTSLGPIILYGNQHGGNYGPAVDAQRINVLGNMGDLNIFRNPYNAPTLQVPYFAHAAVDLPPRDEPTPGNFDHDEIGLTTAANDTSFCPACSSALIAPQQPTS